MYNMCQNNKFAYEDMKCVTKLLFIICSYSSQHKAYECPQEELCCNCSQIYLLMTALYCVVNILNIYIQLMITKKKG